jgi:hypothetical protein
MVMEDGSLTAVPLSESVTTAPLLDAGPERVTVQVLGVPPITSAGAHNSDVSVAAGALTVSGPVFEAPL